MLDAKTRALILASPWLFLLHEYEEYRTGVPWLKANIDTIPSCLRAHLPTSPNAFLFGGLLFFVVYVIAGYLATRPVAKRWTLVLFAVLILARLENALTHLAQFILLRRYTPGIITALIVVLPVCVALVSRFAKFKYIERRAWFALAAAAMVVQVLAIGMILSS
ncbi:MAG TPA: HXXEE domain-containing protein [Longimicrobiales bacterium]|nr:HXXEE domain-containing protein [Longimicrobiales bacterium]